MVNHPADTAIMYAAGAFAGLVAAVVITLNLHILVGLEQGYAASPPQVVEYSMALALFDLLLLIAAPALGVFGVWHLRRRNRHQPN